jgi:hypothetical protein
VPTPDSGDPDETKLLCWGGAKYSTSANRRAEALSPFLFVKLWKSAGLNDWRLAPEGVNTLVSWVNMDPNDLAGPKKDKDKDKEQKASGQ